MLISAMYVAMGLAVAGRTLLELAQPRYYDPVTTLDYVAVWSYSLALGLLAIAIPLLARDAHAGRLAIVAAIVTGSAAGSAAVANAIEDGIGLSAFRSLYVPAVLVMMLGLLAVALLLAREGRHRAAIVAGWWCAVTGVSLGFGVLVLVGSWLAARDRSGLATVHTSGPEEGRRAD